MVAGHHDQGFGRMLFQERAGHADGIVEGDEFSQRGGGIVGMAGPVDLAAFHHDEETLRVALEIVDRCLRNFRKRKIARRPVDGIGHGNAVMGGGHRADHLAQLLVLELQDFFPVGQGGVACVGECLPERHLAGIPVAVQLGKKPPAEKIESALRGLVADFTVAVPLVYIGVVPRRRGV